VYQAFEAERLVVEVDKVVLVIEEAQADNAPHVVRKVGIEEVHRPPFTRGRKTAQHQHSAMLRQEGWPGMGLCHGSYFCSLAR